ncbi:MAG: hypothetical protein WDZ80_01835 [Candidatus Paceibacterota bacterium]
MDGYSIFVSQLDLAIEKYPTFKIVGKGDKKFLRGELQIIDRGNEYWESYQLEIKHHPDFPYRFPKVYELSDKIPKIADWHINSDHSFCIDIEPSEIIKCKNGLSLIDFIDKELIPYLFNQTHRKEEGYYTGGEYSHGLRGVYEFYVDRLKTGDDIRKTLSLLVYIASKPRPNRSNRCFCGSGELFRHCHREAYDELKLLGKNFLIDQVNILYKWSGLQGMDQLRKIKPTSFMGKRN